MAAMILFLVRDNGLAVSDAEVVGGDLLLIQN